MSGAEPSGAAPDPMDGRVAPDGERVAFRCADFPGYAAFTRDAFLREALLAECGEGDAALERASALVAHHVLDTEPYQTVADRYAFSHRLHRMGYGNAEIARALASAWLAQGDEFLLPRRRKRDLLRGRKSLAIAALAIALGAVVAFVLYVRAVNPQLGAVLLGLEPVLAAGGLLVAIPLFLILDRVFGHRDSN